MVERVVSNACHAVRYCDVRQVGAVGERILFDACHVATNRNALNERMAIGIERVVGTGEKMCRDGFDTVSKDNLNPA